MTRLSVFNQDLMIGLGGSTAAATSFAVVVAIGSVLPAAEVIFFFPRLIDLRSYANIRTPSTQSTHSRALSLSRQYCCDAESLGKD